MSLSWLPLLMPFIYAGLRRRFETLCVGIYYLAATWTVVPGSHNFFGQHATRPAYGLWLFLALLGTLPWIIFFYRKAPELSAVLALAALALPPLSLVTLAHPLTSAGIWFPGTAWVGLLVPIFLLAAHKWLPFSCILGLLALASVVAHALPHRPEPDLHIVAINTNFGGLGFDIDNAASPNSAQIDALRGQLHLEQSYIERAALAHPGSIVVFPEGAIRAYSPFIDQQWKPFLDQLAAQHTTILFGTAAPLPNTRAAYRNILATRGWSPNGHFAYVQRVPVPISMWKFGSSDTGFPLLLRNPGGFKVRDHRAGVLMCYEQLLAWPALETLAEQPDFLLAPRNVYWAKGTTIPAIQHQAAQSWANLWGIPLYEAQNQ